MRYSTPIYRDRVKCNKNNETKMTKVQSVEPEIYNFKGLSIFSTRKLNALAGGIWSRYTGTKLQAQADCSRLQARYRDHVTLTEKVTFSKPGTQSSKLQNFIGGAQLIPAKGPGEEPLWDQELTPGGQQGSGRSSCKSRQVQARRIAAGQLGSCMETSGAFCVL